MTVLIERSQLDRRHNFKKRSLAMSIRPTTKSGYEPIPGYTLRKRLGAGGYGEVWLADAPGGLQKAIKLIYGNVDQSHATSELRSLQRIRQVYHPFLLSIERIEIVDSQVIIVTELAESSLLDRFEQCRRKGAPGIERSPLLDFMRDAADALDFLSQKHALQHLDVKPGNLLIIADRIKVADFGLIKDLHDQNQSLVSGLTPTYSAPEIFDGRPDYRSDQYSLAIVYMEMLAGHLPFTGKTMGELARQHLTQQPELDALPPADRAILARALSKNPLDRYGTCRLFVDQLMKTRGAVLPASKFRTSSAADENSQSLSTNADDHKTLVASTLNERQALQPAIDTRGLAMHWTHPRAMFIGLGGMGSQALHLLRQLAEQDCDNRLAVDDHAWAVIDTDAEALDDLTCADREQHVPARHAFELPIFHPREYRDAAPDLFCPLSRRWLYNIPRSLKTEGVRPLAILALLDHYVPLRNRLSKDLSELVRQHEQDTDCQEPLRIYLLSSLHGGTGGGLLAEIGFMVRRILAEQGFSHYRLCAITSAATTTNNAAANLNSAAAISTLSELTFLMGRDHEVPPLHFGDTLHAVASNKPFDWVTLVEGGMHGVQADAEHACNVIATVAWLDAQSALGAALADSRLEASQQSSSTTGWLRSAASFPLSVSPHLTEAHLARWCCEQTLIQAHQNFVGPSGSKSSSQPNGQTGVLPIATASGDIPLTAQACDDFAQRLLLELGVYLTEAPAGLDSTLAPAAGFNHWPRRLARQADVISAQLAEDRTTWKNAIARIIKLRVYNWKQIAQIQLSAIEAIICFYEQYADQLAAKLRGQGLLTGRSQEISQDVREYLKQFSQQCLDLLQNFQNDGRALAHKVHSWCNSIAAEKSLNEAGNDLNLSGLPPKTQLLANRVRAVLESTIHRMAAQQVGMENSSLPSDCSDAALSESTFNLKYILSLSTDLTSRLAVEMGITPEELNGAGRGQQARLAFNQIASFLPAIVQGGSKLYRCVITPAEQEQVTLQTLKREQLDSTTTVIAARRSLEPCLVCESVDIELPQLVNALWRPCPQTLQLAERLRTRVDVEWYPATRLLEVTVSPAAEQVPASPSIALAAVSLPINSLSSVNSG